MSPAAAAQTLKIVGGALVAMSLMFAAAAWSPLSGPALMFYDLVDWPMDGATQNFAQETRLFSAILGGGFASLGVMMILIVAPAVARGDEAIRKSAIIALLTWFVVDSSGSVASGVPGNALLNCVFLAAFMAPLLMVKVEKTARPIGA